jgi:hypothetical protein
VKKGIKFIVVWLMLSILWSPLSVHAAFVSQSEALVVAKNWLAVNHGFMEENADSIVKEIIHFQGNVKNLRGNFRSSS